MYPDRVGRGTVSSRLSVFFTLIINVEGVRGSGKTTWTLSGSSTSISSGTIRTGSGSNSFRFGDSGQLDSRGRFSATNTAVGENSPVCRYGIGANHRGFTDADDHPHRLIPSRLEIWQLLRDIPLLNPRKTLLRCEKQAIGIVWGSGNIAVMLMDGNETGNRRAPGIG